MSTEKSDNMDTCDDNKVVRPKLELSTLLKLAGATKDVLTFKEVMFYLGQYIIQKQLYDKKQQHIVHCAQDALGRILGVDTFSVKEPRLFFAMLAKNLVIVRSQESIQSSAEAASGSQTPQQQPTQENAVGGSSSSPSMRRHRRRRNRSSRSNDAGPSHRLPGEEKDAGSDEDDGEGSKRSRSDSYSLTFDDSLSWCVIGGLGSGRNKHNSQSSESTSASSAAAAADSDDDNFSVEFEVESIDSDDYDEDDASLSADDQVYEFTVLENDDDDSFDEDTEITEADYWRCNGCDELNPPLPRNCLRCWSLRQDWLCASATHPATCADAPGSDAEDGVDVPDGKTVKFSSAPDWQEATSRPSSSCSLSSPEKSWTCDSQPSSGANSQETVGSSQETATSVPELERTVSADMRLPDSCLEPCLICQSRPKNGCIVHGKTGHLMSCYVCARKLKKRNKLCPVCRLPIQAVVLTYLS
ncbi:E3 ubiquitin-protein ligase Mdm2 isoform X2 [Syngnathus scovelli]|uniref:E3 ubiquitin-protein ligase Mdm2 isoform X2 n=1 Tax=Syngnathus scovelli TaxID=161590 RepID=UPI00210F9419|nr:E3 ubiquitin-protein ligase Mdm2 isoform X2 [Syngnathus scovelli]